MCEMHNMYILNGIHSPAAYTCHTGRGESIVDYMLCNKFVPQVKHTNLQAYKITDHDLLQTVIPIMGAEHPHSPDEFHPPKTASPKCQSARPPAEERVSHPRKTSPAEEKTERTQKKTYRWIEGTCLKEYGTSAAKWKAHTSTLAFSEAFETIAKEYAHDNNARSARIEEFLLEEATTAGVVAVSYKSSAKNPNKWAKHFAPWFNTKCHHARARYREAVKRNGKEFTHTEETFKEYVQQCKRGRAAH
jgi:hypothetical protein